MTDFPCMHRMVFEMCNVYFYSTEFTWNFLIGTYWVRTWYFFCTYSVLIVYLCGTYWVFTLYILGFYIVPIGYLHPVFSRPKMCQIYIEITIHSFYSQLSLFYLIQKDVNKD